MNPAVARQFLEKFDAACSVQLFCQTELIVTTDELDVLDVNVLYERYKQWPPRIKMSEAKFIEFLEVTCKLDVVPWDEGEDLPAVIVGAQLRETATDIVKAKRRNAKKPPPDAAALRRAARLPTRAAAAKHLGITGKVLKRLCRSNPTIAALFTRQ